MIMAKTPRCKLAVLRLGQRGRALDDLTTREVSLTAKRQFSHEMLRKGSQKPLRIPRDMCPPADRRAAMKEGNRANIVGWYTGVRRQDGYRIVGRCESNKGVWGCTLQEHARPYVRDVARGVEPFTRAEPALRQ